MNPTRYLLCLVITCLTWHPFLHGQLSNSASFSLVSRLSFYTYEKKGEFLLTVPAVLYGSRLNVEISAGGLPIATWKGTAGSDMIRIETRTDLPPGKHRAEAVIISPARPGIIYTASAELIVLNYKPNEVKYDRLTGGMIVNRRDFFPFGFYCYSPVPPTLPEEEIVRGFNMLSPYQAILPATLGERKAYMDRCARLGMKVHYNLLSLSGGGGVDSKIQGLGKAEKIKLLKEELRTFMDHPALLAWYISDEPNGWKIAPDTLEKLYTIVHETDPWHPVSMVFMSPFLAAKQYSKAFDIVMADPYPVPQYPVSMVGDVTGQLSNAFSGSKPLWMAIQSFGGGELWGREPTPGEIRSMTWQAVIKGATGIQYFVRQGANYFPKSVSSWGECSTIAMEIAELSPWLLSDAAAPVPETGSASVSAAAWMHDGKLLVVAVNKVNEPLPLGIRIRGLAHGKARSVFDNRTVSFSGGLISDRIAPFGTQAYIINTVPEKELSSEHMPNLLRDPGFEDYASPGVPSACYARPGGDRGATYFLDTREHHSGDHSLRLHTPEQGKGITIRLFPFRAKPGTTYAVSIWAKCDPEQRMFPVTSSEKERLYTVDSDKQYVEVSLGSFGSARFEPDSSWRRYMTFIKVPEDTLKTIRTNLILRMPGEGVAWFDDLKVSELK